MPTIEQYLKLERAYYQLLSGWEPFRWGTFGYNPDNPNSHDSNHAYCDRLISPNDFPELLETVKTKYAVRGLPPILRFYVPPNDPTLLDTARNRGWTANLEAEFWRAWPVEAEYEPMKVESDLRITLAAADSLGDLVRVQTEGQSGDSVVRIRKIWEALLGNLSADCLLAYLGKEPVAAFNCVWNQGWGSVGNVETREAFRRRGICSAMLRTMQQLATERGTAGLFLYSVEEGPDRIYARAGFQKVATVHQAHLFLEAD